jgi:hypothetical protein
VRDHAERFLAGRHGKRGMACAGHRQPSRLYSASPVARRRGGFAGGLLLVQAISALDQQ